MSPLVLFVIICVLVVVRVVLTFGPASRNFATVPALETSGGGTIETSSGAPAEQSTLDVVREYLDAFIVAGLVALFLITFVVRTFYIPSGSMLPTLQIHDVLLVNELEYKLPNSHPSDGQIAVFDPPVQTDFDFIKRVIGSPGERLAVRNGVVYRNGVALVEPYIAQRPDYSMEIKDYTIYVDGTPLDSTQANIPPRSKWTSPDTIPPGCYFMMGDNRNDSEDSHVWGFAQNAGTFASGIRAGKPASFTGHAFVVFWPLNRIRMLH